MALSQSRTLEMFRLAVWFGLVAGLLDGVTNLLLLLVRGRPGTSLRALEEILWVSPAFHVALLLVGAAGLLIVFRTLRWWPGAAAITGLFAGVGFFSWFLRVELIPQWALAVLSVGVAVHLARTLRPREESWRRLVRGSLLPLTIVALVAGTGSGLWAGWFESRAVRALPAAAVGAPNVILITLDTLRADHLSSYGYSRATTPHLDELARRGVLFESAFANSSWTLPAHASLFTGRLPHEHKADWRTPMEVTFPTLAEQFALAGYRTAAFAANTSYVSPVWGVGRGFARFEVYGRSPAALLNRTVLGMKMAKVILPRFGFWDIPGRKRAEHLNRDFLRWLDGSDGRPVFAFLNYLDVHDPYLTGAPYRTRFSSQVARGDVVNFQFQAARFRRKAQISPAEAKAEVNGYDACLAYLDAQLGELFAALESRGLLENTLIVLTSDHGEAFGNHDLYGHGNSLYRETVHVPLIWVWPGKIPAGLRVRDVVGLHQLPATLAHLFGWSQSSFVSDTLSDLWSGQRRSASAQGVLMELSRNPQGPASYPNSSSDLQALITDRWHLILSDSGRAQLFAWRDDPAEVRDMAEAPEGKSVVEELKREIQRIRGSSAGTDVKHDP